MFHTIITLAYIIPNIYVFVRVGQLFINKGYKLYYALIYLLITLIYPFTSLFSGGEVGFLVESLAMISGYILPFYLYLFLSLLLFDILLLINRMVRIVPTERLKSTNFKIAGLSALLVISIGVVIAGAINFNTIRVSEFQVDIPRKAAKIDHLKICFVADFHLKEGVDVHYVALVKERILKINPDLMIFGGDIVEGTRENASLQKFEEILREIHPRYGAFAIFGNHEFYGRQGKGQFFENAGMRLINDQVVVIDSSFNLVGRYDSQFRERKSLEEMMKSVDGSLPVLLIDHRPTELEQIGQAGVDISFSGHTHDGQLFPLNLILRNMYPLVWGYKKFSNTHCFVTSGIRLWGPPVRTVGKSEIMVVDVRFK
jgi:predicted MPP superfamily phosphohydrolase